MARRASRHWIASTGIDRNCRTALSMTRQIVGLVGWLAISFAAAAIGGLASADAGAFYRELIRPAWAPPSWLFAPAWTLLYLLMGIAAWLVWRKEGFRRASHRADVVSGPARRQRTLDVALLRLASRGVCLRRDPHSLDADSLHACRFLARASPCRSSANPLPCLGDLCVRAHLCRLERQSRAPCLTYERHRQGQKPSAR